MSAQLQRKPERVPLLTSTDRQRLNKAVLRIVSERCGVMLISSDAQLLAHHTMFLVESLPHDSNLQVSMIEEGGGSLLLERFNGLLGHLSVDQARAAVSPEQAGHVWIMPVQSPAQFASAKTIARMVHDFPGSNLSLVLLIEPEWAQALSKTRPGREMMTCTFKTGVKEYLHSGERPLTVSVKESAKFQFNYDPLYKIFRLQLGSHEIVGCTEQECLLQAVEFIEQKKNRVVRPQPKRKSWWPLG